MQVASEASFKQMVKRAAIIRAGVGASDAYYGAESRVSQNVTSGSGRTGFRTHFAVNCYGG